MAPSIHALARWIRLGAKLLASNLRADTLPYKLNFSVTKRCGSRCKNCRIWTVVPENELSLDEIRTLARNNRYLSWINFTGGEPTDRPDFVEVVRAFADHSNDLLIAQVPTNGLDPERIVAVARELQRLDIPVLVFAVSIDGPPGVNDALRGVKGDFDRAVSTLMRLKDRGIESFVGMTLFPENQERVEETVDAVARRIPGFGYRDMHLNLPQVSRHVYGNEQVTRAADPTMIEVLDRYRRRRGVFRSPLDWVESRYARAAREFLQTGQTPADCAAVSSSCYLSEDGLVYPCSIWSEPIGDVRRTGYRLEPVLRSARGRELRRAVERKDCPNCWTPCEAYQTILGRVLPPLAARPDAATRDCAPPVADGMPRRSAN